MALTSVALAAFVAGALNAVAGGGAFITFPALVFIGVPPVDANATSALALLPGQVTSAWTYRRDTLSITAFNVYAFVGISVVGGLLGALLLIFMPSRFFVNVVPYLMLFATLLFAAGNFALGRFKRWLSVSERTVLIVQFLISMYGGYFGAGIGFLMLAAFTFFGLRDIHAMNGLRVLLAALMKGTAVIAFIIAGTVRWPEALTMAIASTIGGYTGAVGAKHVDQRLLKAFVVILGAGLTLVFFIRGM